MVHMKKYAILAASIALMSAQAQAGAPTFSDTRSLAMGGVGVSAARPAAAGFFNPALLAIKQPEKRDGFGMILPSLSVIANDEYELRDVVDNFEDDFITPFDSAVNGLDSALSSGSASATAAARDNLVEKTDALNQELQRIDQDQARVDVGFGTSFLIPSETFGAGLFISGSARFSGQLNYLDDSKLNDISALALTVTDGTFDAEILSKYNPNSSSNNPTDTLDSNVRAVGAAYSQVGVAMSHNWRIMGHNYALGVSPKMVDLRAYDFVASVEDFDTDDLEDSKVSESKFNFDLGLATYVDANEQVLFGVSVINVLPMKITTNPTYDTSKLNGANIGQNSPLDIELNPKVTAGVSYQGESYEVATDLEITKTEEVYGEGDTQYWGLGAEYDLAEIFQVRAGARYNLAESEDPILTAGFGLRVVGFTFELAGMGSTSGNTLGVSTQLGLTF